MRHGAFMYNNYKKMAKDDNEPDSSSSFALEEKNQETTMS
jgi:hypothetical protein